MADRLVYTIQVSLTSRSGPVLMSLKPGTRLANPYPESPAEKGLVRQLGNLRFQMGPADGAVTGTHLDFMEEVEHYYQHELLW